MASVIQRVFEVQTRGSTVGRGFRGPIAHGMGFGFISCVVIKVCTLKFREVYPLMYIAALLMGLHMALPR